MRRPRGTPGHTLFFLLGKAPSHSLTTPPSGIANTPHSAPSLTPTRSRYFSRTGRGTTGGKGDRPQEKTPLPTTELVNGPLSLHKSYPPALLSRRWPCFGLGRTHMPHGQSSSPPGTSPRLPGWLAQPILGPPVINPDGLTPVNINLRLVAAVRRLVLCSWGADGLACSVGCWDDAA